jgi:methylthioribose-1-phosphate isomerase
MPTLMSIKYSRGKLELLDQRLLPNEEVYLNVESCQDAHRLIKDMAVRGAPAIAVAGMLGLAVELHSGGSGEQFTSTEQAASKIKELVDYLVTRCSHASLNMYLSASVRPYKAEYSYNICNMPE